MHKVFKKEAKKSKKDRLLLSLAVGASKVIIKQGYDVPVLCQSVSRHSPSPFDFALLASATWT